MSPIFAILGSIALLMGDVRPAEPPASPDATIQATLPAQLLVAAHPLQAEGFRHEPVSLGETQEQEGPEDSALDGLLLPDRPTLGRFPIAQILSASRDLIKGSLIDLRSTCLRF
jgi:hypothetical protein